jgi:hypothetical protein
MKNKYLKIWKESRKDKEDKDRIKLCRPSADKK